MSRNDYFWGRYAYWLARWNDKDEASQQAATDTINQYGY